jgi:hypothetical protein
MQNCSRNSTALEVLIVPMESFAVDCGEFKYVSPHDSSPINAQYPKFGYLTPWVPATRAIDVVHSLNQAKYPPVLRDPTHFINIEASVLQLGQSYVLHSVNLILTDAAECLGLGDTDRKGRQWHWPLCVLTFSDSLFQRWDSVSRTLRNKGLRSDRYKSAINSYLSTVFRLNVQLSTATKAEL